MPSRYTSHKVEPETSEVEPETTKVDQPPRKTHDFEKFVLGYIVKHGDSIDHDAASRMLAHFVHISKPPVDPAAPAAPVDPAAPASPSAQVDANTSAPTSNSSSDSSSSGVQEPDNS